MQSSVPFLRSRMTVFLLIRVQLAVDDFRPVPALLVERANALPVIDGARDCDDLMLGAGQAKLFEFFKAVIDDAHVARVAESNSAAEPLFFLHRQDFIEREGSLAPGHGERQFGRRNIRRLQPLDIPLDAGALEWIPINQFSFELLPVASERRCRQVDDLRLGKSSENQFPA